MTLTTLTTHPTRPEAAPAGSSFTGVGSLLDWRCAATASG